MATLNLTPPTEVTIGASWDAKYYTVHFSKDGEVDRIESSFYGYRGRITCRAVQKDGATWRRVLAHMSRKASE